MSKRSRRVEAARASVVPAAEGIVHSAADRVAPLVHTAADYVGPLAQSAADRIGPLADAAADAIGSAADKVSPLAHSAADRLGPFAQAAAERVGPLTHTAADAIGPAVHSAADRISPLAHQAAGVVSPYAQLAVGAVSPYAQQAVDVVSPYAQQAADRIGPLASSAADRLSPLASTARQRGAQAAHDAVDRFGPAVSDALDRVGPAVGAAQTKVSADLLPKLTGALGAAAASPVIVEAGKRGQAALAAAKGELSLPEPKKKGRWLKRLAVLAAIGGVVFVVARRFLGSKDDEWQAARPTAPYAPPKPPEPAPTTESADIAPTVAEAEDDPQDGLSAHDQILEANGQSEPDQPAEGGDAEAEATPVEVVADVTDESATPEPVLSDTVADEAGDSTPETAFEETAFEDAVVEEPALAEPVGEPAAYESDVETPAAETAGASELSDGAPRWSGDGVYVGTEPPEGFTIKGNERSMKYHMPESGGYARTIAEVWFSNEEAAQEAGFVRAQR